MFGGRLYEKEKGKDLITWKITHDPAGKATNKEFVVTSQE